MPIESQQTQVPSLEPRATSEPFRGGILFLYLILSLAIGWGFLMWHVQVDRERTLQSMRNQLAVIATFVSYNFAAMVHDGVGGARAGANEIAARQRTGALSREEQEFILGRMLTGGEYVRAIFVVTEGQFVSAQRPNETVIPNSSQPDWVAQMLRSNTASGVWIGMPIGHHTDSRVMIPIAEKIQLPGGIQWAGAVLSGETFQSIATNLVPEQGGVALTAYDGTVIMRAPEDGNHYVGMNIAKSDAFQRAVVDSSDIIYLDSVHPVTLRPRIMVAQRVKNLPLYASAGRDKDVVLAAWRERTKVELQIGSAASIALAFLTFYLHLVMRRRHEALRASEERFQLAVNGTSDGIWDWNILTDEAYHSPRFKELVEGSEDADVPATSAAFWSRLHPDDAARVRACLDEHLSTHRPYDTEARLRSAKGYRWFRLRGAAVMGPDGRPIRMAGSISDVNERHEAEASLQQAQEREIRSNQWFSEQLLTAQERERARLANELHDSIGQNLSIIKNRAVLALQQTDVPMTARDHIKHLSEVATTAIAELRAVTHNLLPVHVEQWGLTEALRLLTEQFEEACSVQTHSRIEQIDDVLYGVEAMHVFRVVQELLGNVAKHAHATHCRVRVERDVHWVRVDVSDDGVGFPEDGNMPRKGLGFASIEHRARVLKASLRIDSSPNRGVRTRMEIPIAELSTGEHDNRLSKSIEENPSL